MYFKSSVVETQETAAAEECEQYSALGASKKPVPGRGATELSHDRMDAGRRSKA